jgi:spore coat protein U-like protein
MNRLASVIAGMVIFLAAVPVFADTATSNFTVTASVANNCTISTTGITFGAYDPIVANATTALDSTGSVTITCTQGAATTIGLNAGNNTANASGTTRAMNSGTNFLSYEIFQNAGRTTLWGNSGADLFTPEAAPSSAARTFTTHGRVPPGQDVPSSGSYTDTVTATVNF